MRKVVLLTVAGLVLTVGALVSVARANPPTPAFSCPGGWKQTKATGQFKDVDQNGDGFICTKNQQQPRDNNAGSDP